MENWEEEFATFFDTVNLDVELMWNLLKIK